MCKFKLQRLSLLILAILGATFLSGCANVTAPSVYRTYYQDAQCRVFYVDADGNRVYGWKNGMQGVKGMGHVLMKDGNGWYVDSFGNRFRLDRMCE